MSATSRVLAITNLFPTPRDPLRATFNKQQFERLARGYPFKVIVPLAWTDRLRKATKPSTNPSTVDTASTTYLYTPYVGRSFYSVFMLASLIKTYPAVRKFSPDCILASWAYPDAVASIMLGRLLRLPVVVKVHGSDLQVHGQYPSRRRQIAWSLKEAAAVVAVSDDLKNAAVALGVPSSKVHVIYNGVDQQCFKRGSREAARRALGLPVDNEIILFIGNLKRDKGCHVLLKGVQSLLVQRPKAKLYFVGNGPFRGSIEAYIAQNGLQRAIALVGAVEHSKLPLWYQAANVVTLPSFHEGVPNVLLESMACGIPIVATHVGGIPEVVATEAGLLVEPGDASALTEALDLALEREWNTERIASWAEQYTWDRNIEAMRAVIDGVVHKPGKS